jgi:hypothetical protein
VLLSFALAALATGFLLVAPVVVQESLRQSVVAGPAGTPVTATVTAETRSLTLVEAQGQQIVVTLAVPVMIAGLPLVLRWPRLLRRPTRLIAAILLISWVLVTGFSVGLLYAPSAVAMLGAAIRVEE